MTRRYRSQEDWLNLIAEYEQSGQTQAAFCAERGLNAKYFSLKRSKLTRSTAPSSAKNGGFVRVAHPGFISSSPAGMNIRLRIGAVCLELPTDFPVDSLESLIHKLA